MKSRIAPCVFAFLALSLSACEPYQTERVQDAVDAATSDENIGNGDQNAGASPAQNSQSVEAKFGIDPRPVRIGFDGPEADACASYGEINGLNPDGDNFLSVRAAPDGSAEEIDRLSSGTGISLCESVDGWIGVVYEGSGAGGTACGTGSPVADVRDYDGSCRSGWVSQRFVEVIAG